MAYSCNGFATGIEQKGAVLGEVLEHVDHGGLSAEQAEVFVRRLHGNREGERGAPSARPR
jgi:hypothetical protein